MPDDGLDHMTREELLTLAGERGVVLPEGYVTRFELVDLLRQAQQQAGEPLWQVPKVPPRSR